MSQLTAESIATVKATIPFLSENAASLTCHFYRRMFSARPEVKEFFNPAHQASGAQQGALAGAICAFAENIETPEQLADAVELIANKHVSLGVKAEHYPIVGEHLLASIDELLNPAPPEILEAWGAAYGFLADVLIQREQALYDDLAWQGFKLFTVSRIKVESDLVKSFYLSPPEGVEVPKFKPGQYVTVRVPGSETETTMRNYSLSYFGCESCLRISVKSEKAGHADEPNGHVSNFLHDSIEPGSQIELAAPCGEFNLDLPQGSSAPVLLLSGGIGITPLLAMAHSLAGGSTPVKFVHGAIDSKHHAFKAEVTELASRNSNIEKHFRYSAALPGDEPDSVGLFDQDFLANIISPETEVYFCGPKVMMAHVLRALKTIGHDPAKIHYEFFGPAADLESCPM